MTYDIIIPVAFRDYIFLKKTIKYIKKNLTANHIYIITHTDMLDIMPSSIRNDLQCIIVDENAIIDSISYNKIKNLLIKYLYKDQRVGWYLQQFIKMGFAQSKYCNTDYYLSWDADTLPVKPIEFFSNDDHPYFDMKSEHHQPYFDTIEKLFKISNTNSKSYIAEHMMFNRKIMNQLINEIENNEFLLGDNWAEKILSSGNPNDQFVFSEFETYGNYCYNKYPDLYSERQLPSFRAGGVIMGRFISNKIIEQLSIDVYIASFELYDNPPFPWNVLHYLYTIYVKKYLLKICSFKKIINAISNFCL